MEKTLIAAVSSEAHTSNPENVFEEIRYNLVMAPSHDMISLLPDSLLVENILARLPLHEVVSTGVLSKRWGKLWTQIPILVFDELFCKNSVIEDNNRLRKIILDILSQVQKPLLSFTLVLSEVSRSDFDQIMHVLSTSGVEHLKVEDLDLFPLGFSDCKFDVIDFSNLKCLDFFNVEIDGGECSNLVKSCPLLEMLILKDLSMCCYLYLECPNLRVFRYEGQRLDLYFECTPRLEQVMVSMDESDLDIEGNEEIIVPFRKIPALMHVVLDGCFLNYMKLDEKSPSDLINLKCIDLNNVSFGDIEQARSVLCLIRHSPNLETFSIGACDPQFAVEDALRLWESCNSLNVSLTKLQSMKVRNIIGKRCEMLFIQFMLAKTPSLKRMQMLLHHSVTKEECSRISEKVTGILRCNGSSKTLKEVLILSSRA